MVLHDTDTCDSIRSGAPVCEYVLAGHAAVHHVCLRDAHCPAQLDGTKSSCRKSLHNKLVMLWHMLLLTAQSI